jgi:hypothetical protein
MIAIESNNIDANTKQLWRVLVRRKEGKYWRSYPSYFTNIDEALAEVQSAPKRGFEFIRIDEFIRAT